MKDERNAYLGVEECKQWSKQLDDDDEGEEEEEECGGWSDRVGRNVQKQKS